MSAPAIQWSVYRIPSCPFAKPHQPFETRPAPKRNNSGPALPIRYGNRLVATVATAR
jgi:hypothetical protein